MKRAAALLALLATACTTMEPHYVRPDPAIPPSWPVGDPYLAQARSGAARCSPTSRSSSDPRLQTLIAQALANNRDLMVAAANIAAAREQYRIQRAQQLPDGRCQRRRHRLGDRGGRRERRVRRIGRQRAVFSAGVSVPSFELDLFGRVRSLTHVQLERYLATEAGARATRLTLVADIANAWLDYAADSSLLLIAEQTAASAAEERRADAAPPRRRHRAAHRPQPGRADPRQPRRPTSRASAPRSRRTSTRCSCWSARRSIPTLAARPRSTRRSARSRRLPAGLDSYVLLRRPDVRPGRISAARRQRRRSAPRAPLCSRASR